MWQALSMEPDSDHKLTLRVVNALYVEAMVLADEARAYFDEACQDDRNQMSPLIRVTFSCESLKVTTRLMHVIAWLLSQKAISRGEGLYSDHARMGTATSSDPEMLRDLPSDALRLIESTSELYDRIKRLEGRIRSSEPAFSPARILHSKLVGSF